MRQLAGTTHGATRRAVQVALTLVALAATALVSGCSSTPDPGPAAQKLAEALASGTLSDAAWADSAPADQLWSQTFDQMGEKKPTVKVTKTVRTENTAAVTLDWAWALGTPPVTWSYTTSATLTLTDSKWLARWSPNMLAPSLVAGEKLVVDRTQANRGNILGAGDQVLVEPREVVRIGIDKTYVDEPGLDAAARALAEAVGIDPQVYADRVAAAGPKGFVEAIVVRPTDPDYDVDGLARLNGVRLVEDRVPLAPYAAFARPVLGRAATATAELVEASDGAIAAGDTTGMSGLQRQYDEMLRGTPGWEVRGVRPDGIRRVLFHADPVPGEDLRTTIDLTMQQTAESLLQDVEPAAAIVAVRPSTGEIVVVASGPGGGGLSTATVGQYAPGSTFKIVSALALLRAGYTPDQTVTCPESATVGGKPFHNVPGYPAGATGSVSFTTAFAHSCNTAFVGGAGKVTDTDLGVAARSLGLDPASGAGFGAFLGSVPDGNDAASHAAAMIGQGKVLASPLGMATVMASAAGGKTVTPRIVADVAAVPTSNPTTTGPVLKPLTASEAEALQVLLHAVVTDGTAATVLAPVLTDDLFAKTGTAEFDNGGTTDTRAWIVASQGDLAVAVFVEVGGHGAETAGPIMVDFLRSVR